MMRMYDLNKSEQVQEIQGHENSIWSLTLHEKPHGWENIVILSGGADKKIKFWELVVGEKKGSILLQGIRILRCFSYIILLRDKDFIHDRRYSLFEVFAERSLLHCFST